MSDPFAEAARALLAYDAITDDLQHRWSDVLAARQGEYRKQIERLTDTGTIGLARELLTDTGYLRGQHAQRSRAARPIDIPAQTAPTRVYPRESPTHVAQVFSGGLPSGSRRH